jgi:hypothetical protein
MRKVPANKCSGIAGYSCYIFKLNRSISSNGQFLGCATIVFSVPYLTVLLSTSTRNIRGSNPGEGEIFRTRSDRPWGPPSLLYNGYRVFPGGKAAGAWR